MPGPRVRPDPPAAVLLPTVIAAVFAGNAAAAELRGLWEFDNPANLAEATVGRDLIVGGAHTHHLSLADDHSNFLSGVVTTAGGLGSYFTAFPDLAPNGGGAYVNQYSVLVDLFTPPGSRDAWRAIFQTNAAPGGNDADYWLRTGDSHLGVGDLGYSSAPLDQTAWTRLAVTVDLTQSGGDARTYLDGALHYTHPGDPAMDGRFSLYPAHDTNVVHFFADDTASENPPMNVGAIAIFDGVLSPNQVAALGAAGRPVALPEPGDPPILTVQPAGPAATATGTVESYAFTATDPDGNDVQVQADWGDGEISAWTAFLPSGAAPSLTNSWAVAGIYTLRARARDGQGDLSAWVEIQTVTVTGPPLVTLATPPYLQNVRTDGIVIMCETVESAPLAVEFGPDPSYGMMVAAESVASGGGTWFHRAVLTGLNAGQHYHYRYTTAGSDPLTPDAEFRTAPARAEDFRFSFWSDSQGHNRGAWSADPLEPTVSMMKHMAASGVAFGFTAGDLAEDGNSYADTRAFYLDRVARHLGASAPWFVAWGNHDSPNPSAPLRLASDLPSRYRPGFSPGHGSYSFTYANCFFVCIDHFYQGEITSGWLEAQLASPEAQNARFRFLGIHVPPFCERWIDGDAGLRSNLVPLLEKYNVNFCFSGHTHEYGRGELNHVHYVISGGGSWLDHPEVVVRDWPHMVVGGAHDVPGTWARQSSPGVLGPGEPIVGGLFNEYALVTIRDDFLRLETHGFNADGSELGVLDLVEIGADPGPDSDGDGMRDAFEIAHGLDSHDATGDHGADGDLDGDGQSNLAEMIAGTDPGDPLSVLRMLALGESDNGDLVVSWSSVPGKRYRLMRSADLAHWEAWTAGGEVVAIPASPGTTTSRLVPRPGIARGFVRIEVIE